MMEGFMFDSTAICFLACFLRKVQGDLLVLCTDLCQDPWQRLRPLSHTEYIKLLDPLPLSDKMSLSIKLHTNTS